MAKRKLKGLEFLGEAPQEASQNLKAPELAPSDGRITGRTKPLSLKATPEFHKELKQLAAEEECLMIEVLEKALESYKREKQVQSEKELEKYRKIIPPKIKLKKPKLTAYLHANFTCDNCGDEYEQETAYSYARNLEEFRHSSTYCSNCVR
jgi:hypothetical protein